MNTEVPGSMRWIPWVALLVAVAAVPAFLWWAHARSDSRWESYKARICIGNVRFLAADLNEYACDHDDTLPVSGWMDCAKRYGANDLMLRCPAVAPGTGYGYALSRWLAGKVTTKVKDPSAEPLVFETAALGPNELADLATRPKPGRHHGASALAYLDGHAAWVGLRSSSARSRAVPRFGFGDDAHRQRSRGSRAEGRS